MSTGQMSGGYAIGQASIAKTPLIGLNRINKARKKEMKLSLKQRFRNWLNDTDSEAPQDIYVEEDRLESTGIRLQIYRAQGGFVVETRGYNNREDRHQRSLHVVTESEDLGERLGKIVMMEAMK